MTSELEQLKISYEQLSMSPEQIAEDRQLDVNAVKAGLMQCSSCYRKDCGCEPEGESKLNFSDNDLEQVNNIIRNTALYADDEHLRFKAATYIRDDKKGRKEIVKGIQNNTFNLLQFNEALQSTRAIADKAKQKFLPV